MSPPEKTAKLDLNSNSGENIAVAIKDLVIPAPIARDLLVEDLDRVENPLG